jgi:hypothetical protein
MMNGVIANWPATLQMGVTRWLAKRFMVFLQEKAEAGKRR